MMVLALVSDVDERTRLLERSAATARQTGDAFLLGRALLHLAERDDDLAVARARLDEAHSLFQSIGHRVGIGSIHQMLGQLEAGAGDTAGARRNFEEALAIWTDLGYRGFLPSVLMALGDLALAQGDRAGAQARYGEAIQLSEEFGTTTRLPDLAQRLARATTPFGSDGASKSDDGGGTAKGSAASAPVTSGERGTNSPLSRREQEVISLVATGKTNREIAAALVLSEHTVARHLANIFAKLGLPSRAAAAAYAQRQGLA